MQFLMMLMGVLALALAWWLICKWMRASRWFFRHLWAKPLTLKWASVEPHTWHLVLVQRRPAFDDAASLIVYRDELVHGEPDPLAGATKSWARFRFFRPRS